MNFDIGADVMPREVVRALGIVKKVMSLFFPSLCKV